MSWLQDRLGHITASEAHRLLSDNFKTVKKYLKDIQLDLLGLKDNSCPSVAAARGKELESEGIEAYELLTGNNVEPVFEQFFKSEFLSKLGCSPDGLLPNDAGSIFGGVEVKCPNIENHIGNIERNCNRAHFVQCQIAIEVFRCPWWDFVSYNPDYNDCRIIIHRQYRHEATQKIIKDRHDWALPFLEENILPEEKDFENLEKWQFKRGEMREEEQTLEILNDKEEE